MTIGSGIYLHPAEKDPLKINQAVRQLMEGRSNSIGACTLTSGAGTTTVTSPIIGPNSSVTFQPLTANAAAQMTLLRVSTIGAGTMTLVHGNNSNSDQNFNFIVSG